MKKTILTVDDAATMRKVIGVALTSTGHDLLEADDGVSALSLRKTRSVDLIITDVNMPRMDGIEFTRQVRLLPGFQKTPILLLTAESDSGIKNLGRAAGGHGLDRKAIQTGAAPRGRGKVSPGLVAHSRSLPLCPPP